MATTTSLSEMSATIAHRLHVEPLRSVGTGVPWRSGTLWRFYMGLRSKRARKGEDRARWKRVNCLVRRMHGKDSHDPRRYICE